MVVNQLSAMLNMMKFLRKLRMKILLKFIFKIKISAYKIIKELISIILINFQKLNRSKNYKVHLHEDQSLLHRMELAKIQNK